MGDTSIRCANRPSKALTKLRQSDVVIDIIIPLRYFCCAVPDNLNPLLPTGLSHLFKTQFHGVVLMKLAILLVSLTLTCLQPTPLHAFPDVAEHGGKIESKYDGFSHETIITLKKMKVTCDGTKGNFKAACVSVKASLHCPGIQLDYVRYARIEVIFQSHD